MSLKGSAFNGLVTTSDGRPRDTKLSENSSLSSTSIPRPKSFSAHGSQSFLWIRIMNGSGLCTVFRCREGRRAVKCPGY
jgi:hypothetical protein